MEVRKFSKRGVMKNKAGKLGKVFSIFCLAILVSQLLGTTHAYEESQRLRDFLKHVGKYQDLNLAADEYFTILGWVYRLQWDKVLQMSEGNENARILKETRKEYMETLWWELRDYAYQEGEKWKQQGAWPDGKEGMFEQLKGGFELQGKLVADEKQKVKALSMIPSIFEEDRGNEDYDDVSVEALAGNWTIKGTYMSTGRGYGRTTAVLEINRVHNNSGFSISFWENGFPVWENSEYWLLTDDGIIQWVNHSRNITIEFFRERKDYWSGVADAGIDGKVQLVLYRNQ